MRELLAVAAGGALGSVARYLVYVAQGHVLGPGFPFATLAVNIAGSFIMGLITEYMALAWSVSGTTRVFLVVGVLGAFTTFSTFSLDFAVLYERGRLAALAFYVAASFILSVGALFAGLAVVRRYVEPVL